MTSENRRWNRLTTLTLVDSIYAFSDGSFAKIMPLPAYLRMIMEFHDHLDMHHNIEETYVFPVLAQKMPNFANNERHKNSHKVIHAGLDKLKNLVTGWKEVPTTFSPATLRSCLDEFKPPLFKHLEEEVRDLSAENLKKYYTLEEVDRLPM
ncbi:hemerythrin HHE cation-binding domain protein [Rhizoctonia solani 123E]|uniref:Hemerythrin HHE cation-binding domain protein n=1 Tax=Rhizoctonia solani 123E TaxID=1423351 RepID=A0A074S5P2_9AGAM|nr:hemerythrin HHE cation-binding domain protein [Rhizoctonia solani 123E]